MKYAVYVEGKAEMLFVADVLQKYSNYDPSKIGFCCINLEADDCRLVNFPRQGDLDTSKDYYQIVNVNNDNKVISKLLKDIPNLTTKGFQVIIGLRDVFSKNYTDIYKDQKVDYSHITTFCESQAEVLGKVKTTSDVHLHFAIMEFETWMLALIKKYIEARGMNVYDIEQKLNIALSSCCNYEELAFHPYNLVRKIYDSCGEKYGKHGGELQAFLACLIREDYEILRISNCCPSYTKFMQSLLG